MIAGCPNCQARYRIDRDKLVDGAIRLRYTKCEAVFRVRAPEEASVPPIEAPAVETPEPVPQQAQAPQPPPRVPEPVAPTGESVLVALPDVELGKRTAEVLAARGIAAFVVQDGVEAILEIQRRQPNAVVLAADLPKMFGFQVCEVIQRNESLKHIHVILAGAIHSPDRYRRPPEEIYGADDYLEGSELPETILDVLGRAGIGAGRPAAPPSGDAQAPPVLPVPEETALEQPSAPPPPVTSIPAPQPAAPVASGAPPAQAPPQPPAAPGLDEERAKAERLARIIVSDIILYNDEKFARAVAAGNVSEVLAPDLVEGRGLFDERIDARVRGEQDYLMAELLRVARLRGME